MIKKLPGTIVNSLLTLTLVFFGISPTVAATPGDTLASGETLTAGQSITSSNGQFQLAMQTDGNLVEYFSGQSMWQSQTAGPGNYATMQTDGNFVVYNASNYPLWYSDTGGNSGATLKLQTDGNLVVYTSGGSALWANYARLSWLEGGRTLTAEQYMISEGGQYKLIMQTDGNLVEYFGSKALWSSNTSGTGNYATMQTDGNFVVYNSGNTALFTTGSSGNAGARLTLQPDGNLVVYPSGGGSNIWANNAVNDVMEGGSILTAGQSIPSANRAYRLVMQTDGNLVLYNASNHSLWSSGTSGSGNWATMQTDGNFVVYSSSNYPLWVSNTGNHPGSRMAVQNDGNLVVYSSTWFPLWVRPSSTPGATPASGGYPDVDAVACFGASTWCKDENGNGSYSEGEQYSARNYAYRNCTDYVAWKMASINHALPTASLGNANQWDSSTPNSMKDHIPSAGSIAQTDVGPYGHVAYVESVSVVDGKTYVNISQYNKGDPGNYSTETMLASSFGWYLHY